MEGSTAETAAIGVCSSDLIEASCGASVGEGGPVGFSMRAEQRLAPEPDEPPDCLLFPDCLLLANVNRRLEVPEPLEDPPLCLPSTVCLV
mmetsp:Transcript_13800/g.36618  ORF Transcript_13800/g.36618 Transcript_13800/m.36618 type:complete len:90 (+) Transcript_13800:333-602(+)